MSVHQRHWQSLEVCKGVETQEGISLAGDPEKVSWVMLWSSELPSEESPKWDEDTLVGQKALSFSGVLADKSSTKSLSKSLLFTWQMVSHMWWLNKWM